MRAVTSGCAATYAKGGMKYRPFTLRLRTGIRVLSESHPCLANTQSPPSRPSARNTCLYLSQQRRTDVVRHEDLRISNAWRTDRGLLESSLGRGCPAAAKP